MGITKKILDLAVGIAFINENRANGKTDQEIYNELTLQYSPKEDILKLIFQTVKQEVADKYKLYINILIATIIISGLIFFINPIAYTNSGIFCLFYLFFAYTIAKRKKNGFISVFILESFMICIPFMMMGLGDEIGLFSFLIYFVIKAVNIGLSFYLYKKLFPVNIKKLKLDNNGEYVLI